MLLLKYLFLVTAGGLFTGAVAVVAYDVWLAFQHRRLLAQGVADAKAPSAPRWQLAVKLTVAAIVPLLVGLSIFVVPDGFAGVRVSQVSGTRPGALYPGIHVVTPLVDSVVLYDIKDRVFSTTGAEPSEEETKKAPELAKAEVLKAHAREGLAIGLAVTVRYRVEAQRLDHIHANLPQPIETEVVAPVIASVFRQVVPNYTVREVFAKKREEIRQQAAKLITQRLAEDSVVVKEVILRDLVLPVEYAKGLEGLLLKEQESERLVYETEIRQKQVRIAELEAEAQKAREVKQAEAAAAVRVLQAKGEADAMQHTLPLKQKQIEQSRLEAEARKEATIRNAEASAQAKVIDSKAELERRNLLADAEANRIRVTAAADAERMRLEALVLKQNPLLIQKIIAEKLSDKLQIIMVPFDGKSFFLNDVLRSAGFGLPSNQQVENESPPKRPN